MIEYAKTDPEGFWQLFVDKITQFGLKVLAALLIFVIGIWLIRWMKNILRRMFDRKKTEKTIASFITSFVSISLTVLLIIITVSNPPSKTSFFILCKNYRYRLIHIQDLLCRHNLHRCYRDLSECY